MRMRELMKYLERQLWLSDTAGMRRLHAVGVRFVRLLWAIGRDIGEGQLTLRAMSLVYTTLLSLVPLLALSFSVLKAFGVHNQIEPVLLRFLTPFGDRGVEMVDNIIGFVDNVRVGLLGSIGLLILVYTVVSLVQKIESGFNYAWRVPQSRSFASRFSGYLSVLVVGPLLIFGAIGLVGAFRSTAFVEWLVSVEPFGTLFLAMSRLLPYLLVVGAFTFFYMLVPNTRVRIVPALAGGLLAGFMWEMVSWLFANFVVGSARYTAIYASFAIPLLFMFWLYLNWLILLVGAQVAFYVQNPQFITARRSAGKLDHAVKEHLALAVMFLVGRQYRGEGTPWTFDNLSRYLQVSGDPLRTVIERLEARGLLMHTGDDGRQYAPGRDPDVMRLADIVDAMRSDDGIASTGIRALPEVDAISGKVESAIRSSLEERTLHDLVMKR